ncbi:hypothetical protein Fot_03537 [Forsythia ovata]
MSAKVKALQEDLANFRDSDEGKQIFEDGKQAGGMELLDLIKDELPDINFDYLYEKGETASLTLPPENDNDETVVELASFKFEPTSSEVVVDPTSGTLPSQTTAKPALSKPLWSLLLGHFLPKLWTFLLLQSSTQGYEDQGYHPYRSDHLLLP